MTTANAPAPSQQRKKLSLSQLRRWAQQERNISEALVTMLAECASVCLDAQRHGASLVLYVEHEESLSGILKKLDSLEYELRYLQVTDTMKNSYKEEESATEDGACAIALLLLKIEKGLSFLERSVRKTGFDYWLGNRPSSGSNIFANKTRLEVSGIRNGDNSHINNRKRIKVNQTQQSDHTRLPVYVVVVEFSRPVAHIVLRQVNP